MRGWWIGAALLLAGCAAAGGWAKPGADEAATARELGDCRAMAASAVKSDADIDQDILATRQDDWRRASRLRLRSETMYEHTGDRAAAIVTACMRARGFAEAR